MDNLTDLLEEQLKDLFNAENQLLKALPRMAKAASNEELRTAFEEHTEVTREQIERLKQAAEMMGVKPTGKVCAAMQGLIEEGKEVMEEEGEDLIIDGALIAAAQRIEHYEIAAYGTCRALAEVLGQQELAQLFETTLKEEEATDKLLTQVAEDSIYQEAMALGAVSEGEEEEEGGGGSSGGGRGGKSSRSSGGSKGGSKSGGGSKSSGSKSRSGGGSKSSSGGKAKSKR